MYEFSTDGMDLVWNGLQYGASQGSQPEPPVGEFLLQENGFFLEQENGSLIIVT